MPNSTWNERTFGPNSPCSSGKPIAPVPRDAWLWELPTFPFNFSRQPAITVPCGFTDSDLPVGLQIVGPIYEDARTLRAARAYQEAYPTTDRRPPLD